MDGSWLRDVGRIVQDVIFPGRCCLCGEWLSPRAVSAVPVCPDCRSALAPSRGERCRQCGTRLVSETITCTRCRKATWSFASNVALFPNAGSAKELLELLKFGGRRRLAALFSDFVFDSLQGEGETLPVVLSPPRRGRRGPDAVEMVGRQLERRHGTTVHRILIRAGGAQQKTLDFAQRRENLRGRIRLAGGALGSTLPARVVLLDDVFTTGATMDACAQALRDAGCSEVLGMTLVIEE